MSIYYAIKHRTDFHYSTPIRESVMEVRMTPRNEGRQQRVSFDLKTAPKATLMSYHDYLGNDVRHFDIPGTHSQLSISAESVVEMKPLAEPLPDVLPTGAWEEVDEMTANDACWEWLQPSTFARTTPLLQQLREELELMRRDDPMTLLRELNHRLYEAFAHAPRSTQVDSPIDDALRTREGVCQDFSHIMTALVRGLGIPCRYVSGYLHHTDRYDDRSPSDATHAWIEALLPGVGWVGLDPTNDLIASERHIRTAVGRDYADVPPTRGVFRGDAVSQLDVEVQVTTTSAPEEDDDFIPVTGWAPPDDIPLQQQQQQQQ